MSNKGLNQKITHGFFITGTDTNVGKTIIATSLTLALINTGKKVCAVKPVASGCTKVGNRLLSDDALMLQQCSTKNNLLYTDINPFAFQEPVSPNFAARKEGVKLSVAHIIKKTYRALTSSADYIIIEGAGGWFTPINDKETITDLARAYGYPVILVVGIRLGCINHAVLTHQCLKTSGVKIAGWVANVIDQRMLCLHENIEFIKRILDIPLLGIVPYVNGINPHKVYKFLDCNILTD